MFKRKTNFWLTTYIMPFRHKLLHVIYISLLYSFHNSITLFSLKKYFSRFSAKILMIAEMIKNDYFFSIFTIFVEYEIRGQKQEQKCWVFNTTYNTPEFLNCFSRMSFLIAYQIILLFLISAKLRKKPYIIRADFFSVLEICLQIIFHSFMVFIPNK